MALPRLSLSRNNLPRRILVTHSWLALRLPPCSNVKVASISFSRWNKARRSAGEVSMVNHRSPRFASPPPPCLSSITTFSGPPELLPLRNLPQIASTLELALNLDPGSTMCLRANSCKGVGSSDRSNYTHSRISNDECCPNFLATCLSWCGS